MNKTGIVLALWVTIFVDPLHAGERETNPPAFRNPISIGRFNAALLEDALLAFTNQARAHNRLSPCRIDTLLRANAREHSREMVNLGYFSHQSPLLKNETLKKRLENAGLDSIRSAGENLAVDFVLQISGVTYYPERRKGSSRFINAKTGKTISNQTYEQFARHMVEGWLLSPQHRGNLLDGRFDRMGVGASMGKLNELDAVFVTQLFTASDSCFMKPAP